MLTESVCIAGYLFGGTKMKIELKEIPVREIVKDFVDNQEEGVVGYGKLLNIRPAFQREFIYGEKQRNEVINTVVNGFPLNVMYWAKNENGYELMDGQQRTLSVCQYVNGDFSFKDRFFHNLTSAEREKILNYKFMVYICEGTDKEKLDWFEVINIAGIELSQQELRNAIYTGPWLTDCKKRFSKTGCPAYQIAEKLIKGTPIRQDYLATVLGWIADRDNVSSIKEYMAIHQHDTNANPLWLYFQSVVNWVNALFPKYRKEMKGTDWGLLYNKYKDQNFDPNYLESRIVELMDDDDVTKTTGIYPFLITGEEKYLSIRAFPDKIKRKVYEKQKGNCKICKKHFELNQMEADHITPWCEGGHTVESNCQMLCKECNRRKSSN